MSPTFPPLAALFVTYFDDLKGQEVAYYASLSDDKLPPGLIEHATLPSGMHLTTEDLVTFSHCSLPGAGLFRSRDKVGGRGRRMGTVGVVLSPPTAPEALFDLATPLGSLYDDLEGMGDPFAREGVAADGRKALLDAVWTASRAESLEAPGAQNAKSVALRMSRGVSPAHPVTYLPALLGMLGPAIVTAYRASLSGQRVLVYGQPPLLPLEAFAWCIWAMGLPPAGAANAGARASAWLGQTGLMQLDDVKKRTGGWVATTSDLMYKSHTDAYDLLIDFSDSMGAEDVRAPRAAPPPPTPKLVMTEASVAGGSSKPASVPVTYAFADLALYRSLVLLDQSPHSVHAETVGFSATSRTGGMWLLMFEVLERVWSLCIGVCEFAIGRGHVGSGGIALQDGDEDAHLLRTDLSEVPDVEYDDDDEVLPDALSSNIPDEAARRGRLIIDQLHHNAHHLYARLLSTAAGGWELTDDNLRALSGASRLSWGGRSAADSKFWLELARTWNVEPTAAGTGAAAGVAGQATTVGNTAVAE